MRSTLHPPNHHFQRSNVQNKRGILRRHSFIQSSKYYILSYFTNLQYRVSKYLFYVLHMRLQFGSFHFSIFGKFFESSQLDLFSIS